MTKLTNYLLFRFKAIKAYSPTQFCCILDNGRINDAKGHLVTIGNLRTVYYIFSTVAYNCRL